MLCLTMIKTITLALHFMRMWQHSETQVQAAILFYPCSKSLYDLKERHWDVRTAMEKWDCTKEILIQEFDQYVRARGTIFDSDASFSKGKLSIPSFGSRNVKKK